MAKLATADSTAKSNVSKFVPTKASKAGEPFTVGAFLTSQEPAGFVVLFTKTKKFIKKHVGLQPTDVYLANPSTASNGNLRFDFIIMYEEVPVQAGLYYPHASLTKDEVIAHKKADEITWSCFRGERQVSDTTEMY